MFSLRHLQVFKAVAETGNFTRAAEGLFITQSAVSHTIRELEQQVGGPLFDRLCKEVRLTASGKLLLQEAAPILLACNALDQRLGQLEKQAPLHIASSITIASFWLPAILCRFKAQWPQVPVYVKVVSAADALDILQAGEADLAFLEGAQPLAPFVSAAFASYPLKLVCAPDYPVGKHLTAQQLCTHPLLLREPGSAIRDTLNSQLLLLGHTARPLWESVNSTALIEAAKAGLGITVLPEVLVRPALYEGTLLELNVPELTLRNDMLAAWHKDKQFTPALQALLACTECAL